MTATIPTQGIIRQQIIEPWLAEVNSDFYTPQVIDYAINGTYKMFCAATLAGPVAQFAQVADGVTRYWTLPTEIVDVWRFEYASTQMYEVPFMGFQNFSTRFGMEWVSNTSAAPPYAYFVLGDYGMGTHPIMESGVTFSLYGPIVPDDLTSESTALLVSTADMYTIAKLAYVWCVERNAARQGGAQAPANYQEIKQEAIRETKEAQERIRRMYGGIRVAGRGITANVNSLTQSFGPGFRWP